MKRKSALLNMVRGLSVLVMSAVAPAAFAEEAGDCWTPVCIGWGAPASLPWCDCDVYGVDLEVMPSVPRTGGFQCAILQAKSRQLWGCQVAVWASEATDVYGLQLAGLYSHADNLFGLQVGSLIAESSETFAGLSVAVCGNMTCRLYGCQIGLFNFTESGGGLQIGLMNNAIRGPVCQLGLVNYHKNGICWLLPLVNFGW